MSDPIRLVLVDDQALFRAGVAVVVDAQPDMAVVGQAGDGREALEVVERTRPDVVLMDLRMPVMDGVEATRALFDPTRVQARTQPLRVVVLTTFHLDDAAASAIRAGASGFLLKDATPEFLCAAIRTVHAGNAVMTPGDLTALLDRPAPARPVPPAYERLTDRERTVFVHAGRGLSNAEIAAAEHLSESTVKTHVSSVLAKLGLRDRVQLVVFAHEHGLLA
ncbi:response regulator transcription factor [Aeromicrobium massiliense]|uniref:response regulator transcription factor n=1 Tax=Aeromicrobium massiliense TaxID=1464554 RepID=UPI0003047EE8|nr:response regulator transcription factor [Aeromicrobium massiliense]